MNQTKFRAKISEQVSTKGSTFRFIRSRYFQRRFKELSNFPFNVSREFILLSQNLNISYKTEKTNIKSFQLSPSYSCHGDTAVYLHMLTEYFMTQGDTAVYLLYAHARICSIIKTSGKDIDELKKRGTIALDHAAERVVGLEEACTTLLPNVLCKYLYYLSEEFTKFYSSCQVNGSAEETSRLLLCEATAIVMRKCFHLLGITPVYKL